MVGGLSGSCLQDMAFHVEDNNKFVTLDLKYSCRVYNVHTYYIRSDLYQYTHIRYLYVYHVGKLGKAEAEHASMIYSTPTLSR